ncbi:hypothetical protein ACKWTF_016048 [Chironomus riparius]
MAEAFQATHYGSSRIHDPTEENHDKAVLKLLWRSGWRSYKKKSGKFKNSVKNLIYPAHIDTVFVLIGAIMVVHFGGNNPKWSLGSVDRLTAYMPSSSYLWQVVSCIIIGFTSWIVLTIVLKLILKILLQYQGYMFEGRGAKVSLKTKIWAATLKGFIRFNPPQLYSFQNLLPRLSVPPLKDTIQRYLRSMRPIVDDENYQRLKREAEDFESGIGRKLQKYLILKSWWAPNYVSDWWEEYVYLKSPGPLMAKSNIHFTDHIAHPTTKQTARAANVTHMFIEYRKKLDKHEIEPLLGQGMVPLCSMQYERLFNTTRIPGVNGDKIVHFETSDHIAVLHKGCWYKVKIHHNGRILKPLEIQYQFDQIVNSNPVSSHGEKYLASLTSWERPKWAETRDKYFSKGINKKALHIIESAAFVMVLDDVPYESDFVNLTNSENLHKIGKHAMCGNVYDIWFDKTFTVNIGTNAKSTCNVEHSWADALVISRLFEETMIYDIHDYDSEGNIKSNTEFEYKIKPRRLEWDFTNENLISRIDQAYEDGMKLYNDVDFQIVVFTEFGKGYIKTCKLSPDAFCQMALQLAYFRDFGKFSLTYEASMTRLFRDGRTETVRACSIESSAWVRAMEDPKSTTKEKVRLLKVACERHQKAYLEAMTGKGIDRHLFCLYIVARYLEVKSPFLEELLSEPWRMSTSQTPHGQSPRILEELKKYPELKGGAGGFGPISYGKLLFFCPLNVQQEAKKLCYIPKISQSYHFTNFQMVTASHTSLLERIE